MSGRVHRRVRLLYGLVAVAAVVLLILVRRSTPPDDVPLRPPAVPRRDASAPASPPPTTKAEQAGARLAEKLAAGSERDQVQIRQAMERTDDSELARMGLSPRQIEAFRAAQKRLPRKAQKTEAAK